MGRRSKKLQKIFDFIDYDDFIIKHDRLLYKALCPKCNNDRGYKRPNKFNHVCVKCNASLARSKITSETALKISKANKGNTAWNKGLTKHNSKSMDVISQKAKGKTLSMETKIKISCTQRDINVQDFCKFSVSISDRDRSKFKGYRLNRLCFAKYDYTCDISGIRGCTLVAHHLDGWDEHIDKRFDISNLICISESIHKEFHKKYGYGKNTKEQYEEFKLNYKEDICL